MNSNSNQPDNGIANAQPNTAANAQTPPDMDGVAELDDRLTAVELDLAKLKQTDALNLQEKLIEYIEDRRKESKAMLGYRLWVTLLVSAMSISLWILLIYCFVAQPLWLAQLGGEYRVPFTLAIGGGAVFLASILVRGVYRVRSDIHADDQLPEHLKQLHEMVKDTRQ